MNYAGEREVGSLVCLPWHSYDADGASATVTGFAASDIMIFKNGNATQRSSSSGITVTTDFDSRTGLHMILIDLSDNADSGFYAAGYSYQVAIDSVTIAGETVRTWVGTFDIKAAPATLQQMEDQIWNADQNNHNTSDSLAVFVKNLHNLLTSNVEGSYQIPAVLRGILSICLGKASGLDSTTAVFRDLADTKNRVVMIVDQYGNRYNRTTLDLD